MTYKVSDMTLSPHAGATSNGVPSLITVAELAAGEGHDRIVIEVDEEAGTYYHGHVPGAVSLDWLDDLQHPHRRGFIDASRFDALMDYRGVTLDTHIVLLGDAQNRYAALVYWCLAYHGHPRLSLLDGGRRAWLAAGLPLTDEETLPAPARGYRSSGPREGIRARRDDILQRYVGAPDGTLLLDCRTPAEHKGRVTTLSDVPIGRDRVTGHIPGSRNLPTALLLDPATDRLLPADELRALFAAHGMAPGLEVAVYCRVADRSALMWFALSEVLGYGRIRHYDGGWAEYGSLVDAPVSQDVS